MDLEAREGTGVTRGQHTVYVMPHDWAAIAQFLEPLIEKLEKMDTESQPASPQLLVLSSDTEATVAIAAAAARLTQSETIGVLAATSSPRAARLLRLRPPQILVGTPSIIADLVRGAAVKLDGVRQLCLAWIDDIASVGESSALESVMTEVPKDAPRTVVAGELTDAATELVERYARRARRVTAAPATTDEPTSIEYVSATTTNRLAGLRRVLDDLDPHSALVFVREHDHQRAVTDLLRSLGYGGNDDAVRAGLVAAPGTDAAILYDVPASRIELREAVAGARRTVALVQPRQIASLKALAGGGAVTPLTLPESGQRARGDQARLRAEVRDALVAGRFARELIALEPLLDEFDGIEIAAATLQLLERERTARATQATASAPHERGPAREAAASAHPGGPMTRLFVNVGSRDGARASDLVGAIAAQGGVPGGAIGRVELRDSHALVEIDPKFADSAIERVTGTTIRGRRAVVRLDTGGGERTGAGGRSDRPERSGRPTDRPARDFSRGGGGKRESRGSFARDDRPPRGGPRGAPRGGPRDESRSGPRRGGRPERHEGHEGHE